MVHGLLPHHFSALSLRNSDSLYLIRAGAYRDPNDSHDQYSNEDEDYYRPPSSSRPKPTKGRKQNQTGQSDSALQSLLGNQRQLGAGLLGIGFFLTFLGIILFFEGNLLRLGNVCLIVGTCLLIGPDKVGSFFLQKKRIQASVITALGIVLVFTGKPKIGLIVEIFGLLNIFGNMFPMLLAIGKQIPVVGDILSAIFDGPKNAKKAPRNTRPRYGPQDYDEEDEPSPRRMF